MDALVGRGWRVAGVAAGLATLTLLAVLTVAADLTVSHLGVWATALDLLVGVAFVLAGVTAPGRAALRVLCAVVGVAWLLASVAPIVGPVHQAVLLLVLAAFPLRRVAGAEAVILVAVTTPVALGLVPQLGVAVLFAGAAVRARMRARSDGVARPYPQLAAAGVAVALLLSWTAGRYHLPVLDPASTFVAYHAVLIAVAAALWAAARRAAREYEQLTDHFLDGWQRHDLEGLAEVLGAALGDPGLEVVRWDQAASAFRDSAGLRTGGRDERQRLEVRRGDRLLAVIRHRSPALEDAATAAAAAVSSAVALTVTNLELLEQLRQRIVDVEQARARILAATDLARERVAADLRENVQPPLALASSELRALADAVDDVVAVDALDVVADQLDDARSEIGDLVVGAPPVQLGRGGLERAVAALAARSPVPVSVTFAPEAAAGADTETALYYVISEALTNVAKHARATRVDVVLRRVAGGVEASVSDDGRGGADAGGSGLMGLADRLATRGGRLRVDSPTGAGTTLVAVIPDSAPPGPAADPSPVP